MAAVTNATSTTSVVEVINSEFISNFIIEHQRAPAFAEFVTDVRDASQTNSKVYAFPKWDGVAVGYSQSSGKTETDEIAAVEQTLTEVTCTASTVAARIGLSDEAISDSIPDQVQHAIMALQAELREQASTDALSLYTSGTNSGGGFTGLSLTLERLGAAFAAYRALNPGAGRHVCVLHNAQMRDLRSSLRSANGGIFATDHGSSAAGGMLDMTKLGFIARYEGVELWESGLVPAASTDKVGAVYRAGRGGAIGMPVWWGMKVVGEREEKRLMTDVVGRIRYSSALVNDDALVKIQSAA